MERLKSAVVLSVVSAACAAVACVAILAWPGAFPAPPSVAHSDAGSEARGWSVVTLAVALPMLAVGVLSAWRGSVRGRIVWAGALVYLVYTYLDFAVSPPFSPLYLLYVSALACGLAALVMVVASIDLETLPPLFVQAPRRATAAFAFLLAAGLAFAWLGDVTRRTAVGQLGWPQGDAAIAHVVHALDMGLLVPLGVATGMALVARRPAGYLLGGLLLVFSVCMGAALPAMVGAAAWAAGKDALGATPFAMLWVVAALLALGFFRRPASAGFDRTAHA